MPRWEERKIENNKKERNIKGIQKKSKCYREKTLMYEEIWFSILKYFLWCHKMYNLISSICFHRNYNRYTE